MAPMFTDPLHHEGQHEQEGAEAGLAHHPLWVEFKGEPTSNAGNFTKERDGLKQKCLDNSKRDKND